MTSEHQSAGGVDGGGDTRIPGYKDKIPASAATAVTAADMFIFGHYYDTRVTTYCAVQGFTIPLTGAPELPWRQ